MTWSPILLAAASQRATYLERAFQSKILALYFLRTTNLAGQDLRDIGDGGGCIGGCAEEVHIKKELS